MLNDNFRPKSAYRAADRRHIARSIRRAICLTVTLTITPLATHSLADPANTPQIISGPTPFAGCSTPGSDTLYPNTAVGPSIATNPTTLGSDHVNLIAVWEQDKWAQINSRGLVAAYSFDDGNTWARTTLPFGHCAVSSMAYDRVSHPWVSIGPDGTAYVTASGTKPDGNAIWAATSHDGGKTWGGVSTITENTAASQLFAFRPAVTADGAKPGVAYLSWTQNLTTSNGPQMIWFSKTNDGGNTWSKPKELVHEPNWSAASGDHVLVDNHTGTIYETYLASKARTEQSKSCRTVKARKTKNKGAKLRKPKKVCTIKSVVPPNPIFDVTLGFVKSTDRGQTWSSPATIRPVTDVTVPAQGNTAVGIATLSSSAIDPTSGKLYIAVPDGLLSNGQTSEITIVDSSDDGATWSSPARVSSVTGVRAFLPTVAVNSTGTVGVTYYDLRHATGSAPNLTADYWVTRSVDGGAHFGNEQHLAGPYNLGLAPVITTRGDITYVYIGANQGLVSEGSRFRAAFVGIDTRDSGKATDVLTESVTP